MITPQPVQWRSVHKTLLYSNLTSNPWSGNHHFECRDLWRYSLLLLFYCLETTHPLHLCMPNLKFSNLTLFTLNWTLLYSSLTSNPRSGNHHIECGDLWRYSPLLLFFILFEMETARQPTLCSTTAQWRSQCTPKTSVLARLTQYWRNKGMTWNARCLCCLVVFAQWTKTRLIYFGNLWGNQDPFGIILKIHQNFFVFFFDTPFPMLAVFYCNKIKGNFDPYPLQIANFSYGQPFLQSTPVVC